MIVNEVEYWRKGAEIPAHACVLGNWTFAQGLNGPMSGKGNQYVFPLSPTSSDGYVLARDFSGKPKRTPGEYLLQGSVISPKGCKEVHNEQWLYRLKEDNSDTLFESIDDILARESDTTKLVDASPRYAYYDSVAKVNRTVFTSVPAYSEVINPNWGTTECGFNESTDFRILWPIWHPDSPYPMTAAILGSVRYGTSYPGGTRWAVGATFCVFISKRYSWGELNKTTLFSESYYDHENPACGDPAKYLKDLCWKAYDEYKDFVPSYSHSASATYNNHIGSVVTLTIPGKAKPIAIPSEDDMRRIQNQVLLMESEYFPDFTEHDRSDLAKRVLNSFNLFDGNTIAYASELPKVGDTIRSTLDLVKNYDSPKSWAKAWLSLRYADRLTIQDTSKVISAFARDYKDTKSKWREYSALLKKPLESGVDCLGRSYTMQSYLTASIWLSGGLYGDLENMFAAPYRWDILPTLENVWDMIPLSFVVDWFVNVSDILSTIDLMKETRFIDAKAQIEGKRREFTVKLEDFSSFKGTLTHISYHRQPAPILSNLRVDWGQVTSSPRPVNYVDGSALLVQSR